MDEYEKINPEEGAEIILWDWLKTKASIIDGIYFNRKNKINEKIFTVSGIKEKPDFILKINDGYGIKFYAVEIKDCSKSINVLAGNKIMRYFKNYASEKTKYIIDGKETKINGFLLATQNSPKGFLFDNEYIVDNLSDPNKKSKCVAAKYKIIPQKEGNRTFEFIRTIWNVYNEFRNDYLLKCDIGIVIGNSEDEFSPYMMITSFHYNKKRWSQRWWRL